MALRPWRHCGSGTKAHMSLSEMIDGSAVAAVIANPRLPDTPIVACNDAFLELTGYGRDEVIGRNCRFLARGDADPASTAAIRGALRAARPIITELRNWRKNGVPFRNSIMIAPIFGDNGAVDYFLGSQIAVEPGNRTLADAARTRMQALTERQRAVLIGMAAGHMNKQIGFELGLTERTIKMHRAALMRALDVRSAAEAIRIAVEAGY